MFLNRYVSVHMLGLKRNITVYKMYPFIVKSQSDHLLFSFPKCAKYQNLR